VLFLGYNTIDKIHSELSFFCAPCQVGWIKSNWLQWSMMKLLLATASTYTTNMATYSNLTYVESIMDEEKKDHDAK
jgi:hypothetical protein